MLRSRYSPAIGTSALMFALGLWGLGAGSLSGAEGVTRWAGNLPPSQLRHLLSHVDAVHGLYYASMHVWFDLVGDSTTMMRLPSAVGMAAAVGLTTLLGIRLSGSRRVGTVAGVLMAALPFIDLYAQLARSYAIVAFFVLATVLALLRALEQPTWQRFAVYAALVAATGWLHEFSVLAVAAHAVTLLLAGTPLAIARRWLVSAAAGVALMIPLVYISSRESQAVAWIHPTRLADLAPLAHDFFGTPSVLALVTGGCALVGAAPLRHWQGRSMSLAAVALPLMVIPPALLLGESAVSTPLYLQRYVLYCVPAAVLLSAAGVDRLASALLTWSWAPALALCVAAGLAQLPAQFQVRGAGGHPQNLAAAAHYVGEHSVLGDGILFLPSSFRNTMLGYPSQFRGLDDFTLRLSPEASGTLRGRSESHDVLLARLLAQRRIWLVGSVHRPSNTGEAQEMSLLQHAFSRIRLQHFRGVEVALYERHRVATRLEA